MKDADVHPKDRSAGLLGGPGRKGAVQSSAIAIRPYRREDESCVLALLSAELGAGPAGARTPEFFRWKHLANPFGPSFMLVAETEGRIIGLHAHMQWRFRTGDRMLQAARGTDAVTRPEYQRMGVFSRLRKEAIASLRGDVHFTFSIPNEKALPANLKTGARMVGKVPVRIRVLRPIGIARGLLVRSISWRSWNGTPVAALTAAEAFSDTEDVSQLLRDQAADSRLSTPRDVDYLRWRYASAPLLTYWAIREEGGGRLRGLAIFRVEQKGTVVRSTVEEVIVAPRDQDTARVLFRRVISAVPVDYVICCFPAGSTQAHAASGCGFLPFPTGIRLAVTPLQDDISPDPTRLRSWALSLGDLEVF